MTRPRCRNDTSKFSKRKLKISEGRNHGEKRDFAEFTPRLGLSIERKFEGSPNKSERFPRAENVNQNVKSMNYENEH